MFLNKLTFIFTRLSKGCYIIKYILLQGRNQKKRPSKGPHFDEIRLMISRGTRSFGHESAIRHLGHGKMQAFFRDTRFIKSLAFRPTGSSPRLFGPAMPECKHSCATLGLLVVGLATRAHDSSARS